MILHADMDAFFASVEQLDHPEWRGRPLVVGRSSGRGVVAAASYEARAFGVHSAMPMSRALKLCPDAIVAPPRMERYKEVSARVMEILDAVSPLVEQVSIDEAYLDISGCERLHGTPETIAKNIKKQVFDTLGITCSVGVAPVKFLAKIASDMNKPDGLMVILPEAADRFIETLPVHKVPGVGSVTKKQLALMGIETLGDVVRLPDEVLSKKLGKFGRRLKELSRGTDDSRVVPWHPAKSVSEETTLSRDTAEKQELRHHLLRQAGDVCRHLQKLNARARVVFIKIKYADFSQTTRQTTLDAPVQSSDTIYRQACALLEKQALAQKVRLIGVGVTELVVTSGGVQMELFDGEARRDSRWEQVDRSVSAISEKFGKTMVKRGSLDE
ncbi:MAG: DNA polymerase IV [Thermodesulfobacteriota bacterium]|nr:DNA polymerase IV [Thermodesulfobacteriota bacterium]